jgi:predicted N-acetyltransferase YhbS
MSQVAIDYGVEPGLTASEYIDLFQRAEFAERRPVSEPERIEAMLRAAQLVVTARAGGLLIGAARSLTDFVYVTYLSDLAVDRAFQGRGVGRELVRRTHEEAGRRTMLVLLAAPKARTYYPHIGMRPHDSCWIFDRES